jgi:N-methylhydantoinase A
VLERLDQLPAERVAAAYRTLQAAAAEFLDRERVPASNRHLLRSADLRYVGQSYELNLPVPPAAPGRAALTELRARFLQQHERVYGHATPDEPIEVVNLRLMAVGHLQRPVAPQLENGAGTSSDHALKGTRSAYVGGRDRRAASTPVYDRYRLPAQHRIDGPAIVEEIDSTTLIPPGWVATVDAPGNLWLKH